MRGQQDIPAGFTMPFYYGQLNCLIIYFKISPEHLECHLKDTGLSPAIFTDKEGGEKTSLVALVYQEYPNSKGSGTYEVDVCIISYPIKLQEQVPDMSAYDFIRGQDQSTVIGYYKFHVICTDAFAVKAGIEVFGEPKFLGKVDVQRPDPNNPEVTDWKYTVYDSIDCNAAVIFTVMADMNNVVHTSSNISPIVFFGLHEKQPLVAKWDILMPVKTYLPTAEKTVTVKLGESQSKTSKDMHDMAWDNLVVAAIHIAQSTPPAVQNAPYWLK